MVFHVEGAEVEVTEEMLDAVRLYHEFVSTVGAVSYWRFVEQEISLAWLWEASEPPEEVYGTLDFCACDGLTLYIVDFKFGRGHFVAPEENTQLMCYALGALDRLRQDRPDLAATLKTVVLTIVQPRAGGAPIRSWSLSLDDLLYWGFSTLKPSIDTIADKKAAELVPGSHCYFCAASIDCPAYQRYRTRKSTDSFPVWDEEEELI